MIIKDKHIASQVCHVAFDRHVDQWFTHIDVKINGSCIYVCAKYPDGDYHDVTYSSDHDAEKIQSLIDCKC